MAVDPKFIQNLKGKDYCTYAGALDAATRAGLKSLTTRLVQAPDKENGHMAIVMARAEFEDGRVFEDVGDCSPQSTSPQLAASACRLASTRAKGRVLRDSVNMGATMYDDVPDEEEVAEPERVVCWEAGCGLLLTRDEILAAKKYAAEFEGQPFCAAHGREILSIKRGPKSAAA